MSGKIIGTFEVKMSPQAADAKIAGLGPTRFLLEKKYHGDLEAAATGEMLAATTAVKGSAGYVAIEKVTGTVAGRAGSFWLQHSGLMTRGEGKLTIVVIPDSGSGELVGITGTLDITIADGQHGYVFEYSLPAR